MSFASKAGLLGIMLAMVLTAGCDRGSSKGGQKSAGQTGSVKTELQIKVPEAGSINDRVRSLWATTMPVIKADASAGLSDAEYQSRRLPLFSAWVMLQQANTNAQPPVKQVAQVIPDILGLIDHLYGFPGTPAAEREKQRQNRSRTDSLIADIDKQVRELPK